MHNNDTDIIRPGTAGDCRAVYALTCDMEAKTLPYDSFKRIYGMQLDSDCYTCLVCERDKNIIGFINLRMEYQLHHADKICEIMELVVDVAQRSSGIGKLLFNAACTEAKSSGCVQIEVCCNRLRLRAHKFYEAQGMHNFHYKFSLSLADNDDGANRLGR